MRTGILGGTFDPPHRGHIGIAMKVMEKAGLDRVIMVPSGSSYMKTNVTDKLHRLNMTRLAVSDHSRIEVSAREFEESGPSYTVNTLEYFSEQYPEDEFFFIIGADTLFMMEKWYRFREIFHMCTVLVCIRDGYPGEEINIKSEYLRTRFDARVEFCDVPAFHCSSTEIRELVRIGQEPLNMLDERVYSYILDQELYQ